MLHLDYLPDWPLSGPGEERRTVVVSLTQDCCALTCLAGGGRLRLVDGRHRTSKLTCLTVSRQLLTVFLGTGNSPALLVLPVSLSFLTQLRATYITYPAVERNRSAKGEESFAS